MKENPPFSIAASASTPNADGTHSVPVILPGMIRPPLSLADAESLMTAIVNYGASCTFGMSDADDKLADVFKRINALTEEVK